jgi:adenosylhomocysteine nucleosidase
MKAKLFFVFCFVSVLMSALFVGCTKADSKVLENPIGIIGAMDSEVNSLKESAGITKTTTIASMEFCVGKLGSRDVVIVKCGMGKVNSGICAHTLINDFGCTKIINTGVAGSLDGRLDIGDIVVSTDAVQHDFDVSPIGFKKGEIPYTGRYSFPADETLRKAAVDAISEATDGVKFFEGRVCSGDQFIHTQEQKHAITSVFEGLCCEMEGGAIAQVCWLNKVPFVIIRAVSDKQDGTAPDEYHSFEAVSAARCAKIVQYMVKNM